MFHWKCWCLIFGYTFYLVFGKSYQVPSAPNTESKQDELEDFVQAYFDTDESSGRSNNKPFQTFEDVLRNLKYNNKKGQVISFPEPTSSASKSTKGVTEDGEVNPEEMKILNRNNPPVIVKSQDVKISDDSGQALPTAEETVRTGGGGGRGSAPSAEGPGKDPEDANKLPPTTSPTSKRKQFGMSDKPAEVVNKEEMSNIFFNSGRGSSVMIPGCDLTHFHVKSRCAGNLLELTLLSRNPVRGQVRLLEGDGQVTMEGTNLVVYGVLGPLTPSGNLWRLTQHVLKNELQKECYICDSMNVRVVLKVGGSTCGMGISCQQKGSSRIVNMEDKLGKANNRIISEPLPTTTPSPPVSRVPPVTEPPVQDPANTAKTTMTLTYSETNPDMAGTAVSGMVSLGTRMSLVLSVYSKEVTLDLHVVKCMAKGDDGRGVQLVKDGCSSSSVMGEFKEVLGIVQESSFGSHNVRKVSQFADLRAFNFRRSPQNITLICTIKMCGGECTERPPCVISDVNLGRSTRPPVPIFTQEVTLGKVFHVGGLPLNPAKDISGLMLDTDAHNSPPVLSEKYPDDCITRKAVLILLGFVTCVYLGLLLLCIYCVRRSAAKAVKKNYMEDYESPPKALFSEYNSPRRRTPQTSPAHTTFSINTEEYKSPSYQKNAKQI